MRPDPKFYRSARLAMEAEPEHLAYTVLLSPDRSRPDALATIDVDPNSKSHGSVLSRLDMPNRGDEFHHFGWNACNSALSPMSGHALLRRRYLIIGHPARPGPSSSRRSSGRYRRSHCSRSRPCRRHELLARASAAVAVLVATVHTLAMMLAGLAMAWAVYRYLGLKFLRRAWFNLDLLWGASLVLAGAAGVGLAL